MLVYQYRNDPGELRDAFPSSDYLQHHLLPSGALEQVHFDSVVKVLDRLDREFFYQEGIVSGLLVNQLRHFRERVPGRVEVLVGDVLELQVRQFDDLAGRDFLLPQVLQLWWPREVDGGLRGLPAGRVDDLVQLLDEARVAFLRVRRQGPALAGPRPRRSRTR